MTTHYTRVTYKMLDMKSERTVSSDEHTDLVKASDPRAPGPGIEIVRKDYSGRETQREFVSVDNIASLIYAPREVAVEKAPVEKAGAK